ncbi:MAG: hypothetical protein RLZZ28_251 [Bacteroidota bacterium]|jgi:hypothetical protein
MISASTSAYKMISRHGFADIMENGVTGEKSLHATSFFDTGEIICAFAAEKTLDTPTYLTLQTGKNKHITLSPGFLQYVNHSCEPNVFFDTSLMKLQALKEIQPGDEFVFFYPSTEWEMIQPFECFCGTQTCLHKIQGAAHLTAAQIKKFRLTDFILEQLQNQP